METPVINNIFISNDTFQFGKKVRIKKKLG